MLNVKDILDSVMEGKHQIAAGEKGLDRIVETVGILEYEVGSQVDESFFEGDFVITSLYFAKDCEEIADDSLIRLMKNNVSAIALKTVHVDKLSENVLNYANKCNIPIIYFNDIHFEVLIMLIIDSIRQRKNYLYYEEVIKKLLVSNNSRSEVESIAYSINNSFLSNIKTIYCKEKSKNNLDISKRIIDTFSLKRSKTSSDVVYSIFEYKEGLLIIYSYSEEKSASLRKIKGFIQSIGISHDIFHIGISSYGEKLENLDYSVNKALYAYNMAKKMNLDSINVFEEMGIYKLIYPLKASYYAKNFSMDIIEAIISYDNRSDGTLFMTAKSYVDNNGSIKETSKDLHQHINTIRYRINKIKEITGLYERDFYEQLFFAMKFYEHYDDIKD